MFNSFLKYTLSLCPIKWNLVLLIFICFFSVSHSQAALKQSGDLAPRGAPDGLITLADYLILKQSLTNTLTPALSDDEAFIADIAPFNASDSELNVADLLVLKRAVLGEIVLPMIEVSTAIPTSPVPAGDISGTLENVTLTADTTYTVVSDVTISADTVMNIEPGAIVKFDSNTKLIVNGALNAQGTTIDPIHFTSTKTSPKANDWTGIEITNSTSEAVFKHVVIEYASKGLNVTNSSIDISDSEIHQNAYGLYLKDSSGTISNNHIHDNGTRGIYLTNSSPTISGNT
ncbi:MAG: right-handed parallel beta-helix repeat-containing protein, partial [Gammaproteobacteria bacterium]|nr:right-handed parallel beta-helix repeat-containing protein [Gammaproteobacteria bacterium]